MNQVEVPFGELGNVDYFRRRAAVERLVEQGSAGVAGLCEALPAAIGPARASLAEALGRIGDVRALDVLSQLTKDRDSSAAQRACEALGHLCDAGAVPALGEALRHPSSLVRWQAVVSLGQIAAHRPETGSPVASAPERTPENPDLHRWYRTAETPAPAAVRAIAALACALNDEDPHVRRRAVEALVPVAAQAGAVLLEAATDRDDLVRRNVMQALGQPGNRGGLDALVGGLGDRDVGVRRAAVTGLGRVGDPRAVEPLLAALGDSSEAVRVEAVEALGRIPSTRGAEALCRLITSTDSAARLHALRLHAEESLVRNGTAALPSLIQWLADARGHNGDVFVTILYRIGPPAVAPLCEVLQDRRPLSRLRAARALGEIAERCPTPILRAALPRLRQLAQQWGAEEDRRVYRVAAEQIETATEAIHDLPRPGRAPEPVRHALPLVGTPPADAVEPDAEPAAPSGARAWWPWNRREESRSTP